MGRMVSTKVNVHAVGIGAVLPSVGWVGCNDGGTALECYVWGLMGPALSPSSGCSGGCAYGSSCTWRE